MFEDSEREIQGYQKRVLQGFLEILAPPSSSPYDAYARDLAKGGRGAQEGVSRSASRVGEDSFGPSSMDVPAIVSLLVDRSQDGWRGSLGIPSVTAKVRQELHNIRNDRNDLVAHQGTRTDLSSLWASFVLAEHVMRFLIAVSKEPPQVQSADVLTDYVDRWLATIRRFVDGLEEELLDYEESKLPERKAQDMLDTVLLRQGDERDAEYTRVWLELHKGGNRKDDYGHDIPKKQRAAAERTLALFDIKAADAGVARAVENVRDAALYGSEPWFRPGDYASRASALLRLSRADSLTPQEKIWLAGAYKCGFVPTHSAEEGDRLLEECKAQLGEGESIEEYESDGHTFYRITSERARAAVEEYRRKVEEYRRRRSSEGAS